jgi:Prokaryotic E2 family E
MFERRERELELVKAEYGDLEIGEKLDWVIIKKWLLSNGWNKTETQVLVLIPPGYPVTPPDNFYTDNDLRLLNGGMPGNSSVNASQLERLWLQFSHHVEPEDWKPHADVLQGHNLLTFLKIGVARRLSEAN